MTSAIYDGVEYVCTVNTFITDDITPVDVYTYPRMENGRFAPIPEWDF